MAALIRNLSSSLASLLLVPLAVAQVQVDWVVDTRGVMVAVDAADNVFTADYEQNLGTEISVTKRDVDGNLLWTAEIDQTDGTKWERATWVAVDSQGDVLVSGTLMSGFSNPVEAASLLLKFAADGTPLYRIVYESGFDGSWTRKLLLDEADNAYVLGMGSGPSGFVTKIKKFAPDGSPIWSWFDADGIGAPVNFKFAANGDMVVAGRAIFGSINGYARVDRQGNGLWAIPGVQSLTVGDAAGDAQGNTYLVHGEFVMNGGTVVRKVDAQGGTLWSNVYAGAGFRVEVPPDQAPIVSGFPSTGQGGAAFFKVAPTGALLWSNPDADGPLGLLLHAQMLVDAFGNAYLAAGTLFEMAACKVNADGSNGWTATVSGSSGALGIALGNTPGSLFMVGGRTARLVEDLPEIGSSYCIGAPNSAGAGASIAAFGSTVVAQNEVLLTVGGLPPGVLGLFIVSDTQAQVPFGDGFLCLGGSVNRILKPQVASAQGGVQLALDLQAPPLAGAAVPGATLDFQYWYRDPGGPLGSGFNLSDARAIAFQ